MNNAPIASPYSWDRPIGCRVTKRSMPVLATSEVAFRAATKKCSQMARPIIR